MNDDGPITLGCEVRSHRFETIESGGSENEVRLRLLSFYPTVVFGSRLYRLNAKSLPEHILFELF